MDKSETLELTFDVGADKALTDEEIRRLPYAFAHDRIVSWRLKSAAINKADNESGLSIWVVTFTFDLDDEIDSDGVEYFISFYHAILVHSSIEYFKLVDSNLV